MTMVKPLYVNVSKQPRAVLVGGKGMNFPPWFESPGLEVDESLVVLLERKHLVPGDKWKRLSAETYDKSPRFLVRMVPGLITALIERDKQQPAYGAGTSAGNAEEQPSKRWALDEIRKWMTGRGILYGTVWSKERTLRAALEGPTQEDMADVAAAKEAREKAKAEA